MISYTLFPFLFGGFLLGIAAGLLYAFSGKILGVSGIIIGLLPPITDEKAWRIYFLIGMALGGISFYFSNGIYYPSFSSPIKLISSGILVGVGTYLAGGCTSGHSVCGISRLSPRSLIATVLFILFGIIAVQLQGFYETR